MIVSFKDKDTGSVFDGVSAKRLPNNIQKRAKHKLDLIHLASDLEDLRLPPSNHLEKLIGDRKEQYSIRINAQWRICFTHDKFGFHDVQIVDYH